MIPCRCMKCWKRRNLPKYPAEYVTPPKCKQCGAPITYVCRDRWSKKDKRNIKCNCTGYMFQHRKGSKWCYYNVNYPEEERAA